MSFLYEMLVDEEDGTFLKAFRNLVSMATEAREEQKRRVILSQWDDEDWWWWKYFSLEGFEIFVYLYF